MAQVPLLQLIYWMLTKYEQLFIYIIGDVILRKAQQLDNHLELSLVLYLNISA